MSDDDASCRRWVRVRLSIVVVLIVLYPAMVEGVTRLGSPGPAILLVMTVVFGVGFAVDTAMAARRHRDRR